MAIGLKKMDNNTVANETVIDPYEDSIVHNSMRGDHFEQIWRGGIFSGVGFNIDNVNKIFYIEPGYGMIYGREFEITETYSFELGALTGVKYCVIYVEIDLQNVTYNKIDVKLQYAGANYPNVSGEDLIENKTGIARMPLYKFIYRAESNSGTYITDAEVLFYSYDEGVVEHVRYLEFTSKLNGRSVANLLHYNADRWKNSNRATFANLGKSLGNTSNAQTISDTLQLGKGMYLLQVSNGCFHVTGQDQKDEPKSGKYLNENKTYKFYYEGSGVAKPRGCTVVGVMVTGYISYSAYEGISWLGGGWSDLRSKQIFRPSFWNSTADDTSYLKNEHFKIFDGDVWGIQRKLWLGSIVQWKSALIGSKGTYIGTRLTISPPAVNLGGDPVSEIATFQFRDVTTDKPYLEVVVEDNYRLMIDLTFRLLMIGGSTSEENQDINAFSGLNPKLEGGQT